MSDRVRIGTRGSALALRQAEAVATALRAAWAGLACEVVPIRTSGDRLATAHLAEIGGKGLFVKEIDDALLGGRVDVAVHSLKDLPALRPDGVVLAAFPPREDPRDVLVADPATTLGTLPRGARVGTSSLRRSVQLRARRPDVRTVAVRGNVDTRLQKLRQGQYEALLLAAAGLRRLGLVEVTSTPLDPDEMLPAIGQGTLAVECRADDARVARLALAIDDPPTRAASLAERALLASLGGACTTPLAAYARIDGDALRLDAWVATPDGVRALRDVAIGDARAPEAVGRQLAGRLLGAGAGELVQAGRTS
ncbi:MAG TPA: hydroxymethylbilane synthase [Methylomirabilota bacterium]|nr:hydroxymethylbilane synthase [Methylomirabilota bacterium]